MSTEEDALLLAELIRELTGRGFILTRFLKQGKLAYGVIFRLGSQPLSLMAKVGDVRGVFTIHRFLVVNSLEEDRPIVIAWKRGEFTNVKFLLFDPKRVREDDDGYGPTVRAPLSLAHPWPLSQDLGEAWTRIKQLRKKPAPLDRFTWKVRATNDGE